MIKGAKASIKQFVNRLLLRPEIWDSRQDLKALIGKVDAVRPEIRRSGDDLREMLGKIDELRPDIRRSGKDLQDLISKTEKAALQSDLLGDSQTIIEKKINLLISKVDAHSELLDERFRSSLHAHFSEIKATTENADRALSISIELASRNLAEAIESIGRSVGELNKKLSAIRLTGENTIDRMDGIDAKILAIRGVQETLAQGLARVADEFVTVHATSQSIGGRIDSLESAIADLDGTTASVLRMQRGEGARIAGLQKAAGTAARSLERIELKANEISLDGAALQTSLDASAEKIASIAALGERSVTMLDHTNRLLADVHAVGERANGDIADAATRLAAIEYAAAAITHGQEDAVSRLSAIETAATEASSGQADAAAQLASIKSVASAIANGQEDAAARLAALARAAADADAAQHIVDAQLKDLHEISARTLSSVELVEARTETLRTDGASVKLALDGLDTRLIDLRDVGVRTLSSVELVDAKTEHVRKDGTAVKHALDGLDTRLDEIHKVGIRTGSALDELAEKTDGVRIAGQADAATLSNAIKGAKSEVLESVMVARKGIKNASIAAAAREAKLDALQAAHGELRAVIDTVDERLSAVQSSGNAIENTTARSEEELRKLGSSVIALGHNVSAVELNGKSLGASIGKTGEELRKIGEQVAHSVDTVTRNIEKLGFNEFRQREALDGLLALLKPKAPLPATRGWAASPDFLLYLYQHIVKHKPKIVVELGGGVSSLVVSAALKANGSGRLYSLDHDASYAKATEALLAEHGLSRIAEIFHAPLTDWKPKRPTELGNAWQWYTVPDAVKALRQIDLLIVDGPPKPTGENARYPAVPVFRAQLSASATVLLDDARRPQEKAAVKAWSREDRLTLEAHREFEKGLAILYNPSEKSLEEVPATPAPETAKISA